MGMIFNIHVHIILNALIVITLNFCTDKQAMFCSDVLVTVCTLQLDNRKVNTCRQ